MTDQDKKQAAHALQHGETLPGDIERDGNCSHTHTRRTRSLPN
jgi:hypothetical protein